MHKEDQRRNQTCRLICLFSWEMKFTLIPTTDITRAIA